MNVEYFIGFDVGSEFVHSAIIDKENELVYTPKSKMHFGNPGEVIKEFLDEIGKKIDIKKSLVAFTGSGGKVFANVTDSLFFYDTLTIPLGAHLISPKSRYVFHIGAKDPYFFEISEINNKEFIIDNGTGTKCGGGSGILITKQCRRLFSEEVPKNLSAQERMEKMYELSYKSAIKSNKRIDVGGRCGVVIQSDMIHLQNSGESIENILRGLFERISQNYKADVIRMRNLDKSASAVITGGVGFNDYIVKMLEEHTGLKIVKPKNFEKAGAIGAALRLKADFFENKINKKNTIKTDNLKKIIEIEKENIAYAPSLSDFLPSIKIHFEKPCKKFKNLNIFISKEKIKDSIPVIMGVDGGSTTTKAFILMEKDLKPVAEICIETHGKPLQAAQNIFGQIKDYYKDKLDIKAVAYTGSSGAFYYKLFTNQNEKSADISIDEITCHALGVKHFNKKVDTIFELGGQDAKFTLFKKDGGVKKAKMNLSCMAGTGQTMQNMINMIGLDFDEFEKYALKAKRTPVVDETCGVFTEADIAKLISLGLPKEEIAAAIAYGFIGGYINKFVGSEKFGEVISAQGGPFKNKACLAALASHTKCKINAFPHRQLFGAYGAALAAYDKLKELKVKESLNKN